VIVRRSAGGCGCAGSFCIHGAGPSTDSRATNGRESRFLRNY
jgi:hypothetical protein